MYKPLYPLYQVSKRSDVVTVSRRIQQLPSISTGPIPRRRNFPTAPNPSIAIYNRAEHNIFFQMQAADPLVRRSEQPPRTEEEVATAAAMSSVQREGYESPEQGQSHQVNTTSSASAVEKERSTVEDKETAQESSVAYEKMEDTEKKA